MLLRANTSCVLLVDVQEKLTPHVLESESLIANCRWLLQLAKTLNIPICISEQYPKGLGSTVASLRELIPTPVFMEKVHFSCASDLECFKQIEALKRKQIVVIGIETHVCIMQTAIELQGRGKQVYVVADAVSARNAQDHQLGLERMRAAGIQVITKEMAFFEWIHQAGTPEFKQLSKEFLQ